MKKMVLKCTIFLSIMVLANLTFAQDVIILKTGDEIKSKVLEITPDLVKYKKWENHEGPAYSVYKSDVFMIKYANGTKDVFNTVPTANSNTNQISNTSGKFLGVWQPINTTRNHPITITKSGDNFIVQTPIYDGGNGSYRGDQKLSAYYIKEQDKLEVSTSYGKVDIIFDASSQHLIFYGTELQKISNSFNSSDNSQTQQPQNSNSQANPIQKSPDLKVQNNRVPLK